MIVVSGQALITLDRRLDLTKVCLGSSSSDVLGALRIKPADGGRVHKIIKDLEMPSLLPILHGARVLSPVGGSTCSNPNANACRQADAAKAPE